jgi:hypothetical protein
MNNVCTVDLDGTVWPKIENVDIGMMREMSITLNTKEGKRMAEATTILVIKTKLNCQVPVGTGTRRSGIGSMIPGLNETGIGQETEMIHQMGVVTGITDIMILGENTGAVMVIEDLSKT